MNKVVGFGRLLLLSFMVFISPAQATDGTAENIAGPVNADTLQCLRMIWTADPQSQAMICWDTAGEGMNHRVYYDTESRKGIIADYKNIQESTATGPYYVHPRSKSQEPTMYYHHTQLKNLEPDTIYYFVFASGDAISREFHFRTAPAEDKPFKIIFGSDSQGANQKVERMYALMANLLEKDDSILALAHSGDFVGTGDAPWQWEKVMTTYQLTTTFSGRILPLMPAHGNHDVGPVYEQVMAFPGGKGNNYYATRLSSEVLWVVLNTCGWVDKVSADGPQKEFLAAALAEAHSNRWKVAHYHDPVYPALKRPSAGLQHWVPLFEKHNLALACEGDGHLLKRTVPIRNGKQDPTGVVYIGEGGLNDQRPQKKNRWYVQPPGMSERLNHFHLLSFGEKNLTIEVYNIDGNVIDTYVIDARDAE